MLLVVIFCTTRALNVSSCQADLGYRLLGEGNAGLLAAPDADFEAELVRMDLKKTRTRAVPPGSVDGTWDHGVHSMEVELRDLQAALKRTKTAAADAEAILARHREQREKLGAGGTVVTDGTDGTDGVPGEFADYLEGLLLWRDAGVVDKGEAMACWKRLLARPEAERRYKSVWAAYMLGRATEETAPGESLEWYRKTRALARAGWSDSLGLAAASLGREARVQLRQKNHNEAIELYLEQMAAGDPTAANSLRFAAQQAVHEGPARLAELARHPLSQKVITAWLISFRSSAISYYCERVGDPECDPVLAWLEAVERAGVKDVDSAEKLALAAYRVNRMDLAARWCARAPQGAVSCWIQAKLLLRKGQVEKAGALLARIAGEFPVNDGDTNKPGAAVLQTVLSRASGSDHERVSAARQLHAELGVLQLSRSQYVESLDTLLRAGFWGDAAYVAERVLTTDELKAYVDETWSAAVPSTPSDEYINSYSPVTTAVMQGRIRYLLARRLTRDLRGDVARPYYPADCVENFDRLARNLVKGWNESAPAMERAQCLTTAAFILRTNGLELVGTEMEPDWRMYQGGFELSPASARNDGDERLLAAAGQEEIRRARRHVADPDVRYHYRYQAAFLAWEAAKLAPDNTETCAVALWAGGTWLKNRDPETADMFYKALVLRNRNTALGQEADRMRWFPSASKTQQILSGASPGG